MPYGLWVVVGWMALVTLSGFALIAWGLHAHQFDDIEEPKYRMLDDREPEGWPANARSKGGAPHA
jgi:cbb3-type cytochrome oxidase maturation protein